MTKASPIKDHSRFETLDGMRGIAAVVVMVFHLTLFANQWLQNASLAVDIFFMLSGFVLLHSYGHRLRNGGSALDYVGRRLIRLYPMFLFGLGFGTMALIGMQKFGFANMSLDQLFMCSLANALYLPVPNHYIIADSGFAVAGSGVLFPANPPAWSLFFEIVMSMAFLLLCRLSRAGLAASVAFFGFLFLLLAMHYGRTLGVGPTFFGIGWNTSTLWGGFPRAGYAFAFGMLICHVVVDGHDPLGLTTLVRGASSSSLRIYLFLTLALAFPYAVKGFYAPLFLLVISPLMVYAGALVGPHDELSLKVSRFLGWISYPVYCLHLPISRMMLLGAVYFHYSRTIALVASSVVTIVASCLVAKFFDEPVRAWLGQMFKQRMRSVGAAL